MAKLRYIKISNFRGIKFFQQFFSDGITCIIGRGDTCKSTILDSISLVFSQSWSLHFNDSDFYMCDTTNPIIIEGVVSDFTDDLLIKYKDYLRGITTDCRLIDDMESDDAIDCKEVLTIRLTIGSELEPSWEIVSYNGIEPTIIKAADRGKLNVFSVSDYTDRHFSLNKGNPLYSLYKQLNNDSINEHENIVLDVVREAKEAFDNKIGNKFDIVIKKIKDVATELGISLDELKALLDHKDIAISENKVSIHENGIPFRLKGKGSKRLLSLAIQLSMTQPSGIILIDEVEQGLEPDRVQHLINQLSKYEDKQVIITTHSRNVIVEIPCTSLYLMRKKANCLKHVEGELQGSIRKNPEAFFAKKVLVCEGATEVGFCRSINEYRINQKRISAACKGVRFADGSGSEMAKYVVGFNDLSYPTALLCDSDCKNINDLKQGFKDSGITVIDCEDNNSIEQQIFKDVPSCIFKDLIDIAIKKIEDDDGKTPCEAKKQILDSINAKLTVKIFKIEDLQCGSIDNIREVLGLVSKKNEWYKRQIYGELMGKCILENYTKLQKDCKLKNIIDSISNWIEE